MERYFEWDEAKAKSNYRKHGVSFKAAIQVFDDPLCRTEQDRIEGGECRWQTRYGERLFVVDGSPYHPFFDGKDDENSYELVRIISARPATKKERRIYENG